MGQGRYSVLVVAALLCFAYAYVAVAKVPPPPVNQYIGMPDTFYQGGMTASDCRACHGPNPPNGVIDLIDATAVANRHHNLLLDDPPLYSCLSCHTVEPDEGGNWSTSVERNCTVCHGSQAPAPHHNRPAAQGGNCGACHGSLVDNGLLAENRDLRGGVSVPRWLPTYQTSQVTPWPRDKVNAGPNGEGSCRYCHGPDSGNLIDPLSGVRVNGPRATHHQTGLNTGNCAWCHVAGQRTNSAQAMRVCQNCHGIPSLHNIQYANTGSGIQPGRMDPWHGHIGANRDCFGCHGFTRAQSFAPNAGPVIPQLNASSRCVVSAGSEQAITLYGFNFVNDYSPMAGTPGVQYRSVAVLTDTSGTSLELTPDALDAEHMHITLPADLAPGNYRAVARKLDKFSNPTTLVVRPLTRIDSAKIMQNGFVLVQGQSFGPAPPLAQDMGVRIDGKPVRVLQWSDSRLLLAPTNAQAGQTLKVLSTYEVSTHLTYTESAPSDSGFFSRPKGKGKTTNTKRIAH